MSFESTDPIVLALLAGLFTWGVTALGAAGVFFFPKIDRRVFNGLLGFAGGVMIAASFWSLLAPAIELSEEFGQQPWLVPALGFLSGGIFLWVLDKVIPHLHIGSEKHVPEGISARWHKVLLLFTSVTLHNIPEGLAIGVAFGAVSADLPGSSLASAVALAIGIGIQNFPEGFAVSMPFRREGKSRWQSFMYGQSSAIVEPIAAVIGATLVLLVQPILPFALAFAAGAMIFVTIESLIPESQAEGSSDFATTGAMLGFTIMMILDVALG